MKIEVTSDDATFINGAIHEVEIALVISVSVVLLIIYIFLWDWRATIIPAVSMPWRWLERWPRSIWPASRSTS